jgi:hypothetical protein
MENDLFAFVSPGMEMIGQNSEIFLAEPGKEGGIPEKGDAFRQGNFFMRGEVHVFPPS